MFSFIHAADLHLDSPLRGLETYADAPVEQIRMAPRRALDNLVQLAIAQEVDFVLLAGDLYDGDWPDYNTGLYFIQRMGQLQENNIQVFLVAGNHDAANQITKTLPWPANVHHFAHEEPQTQVLEDLGVAIHGQSFASRAVTDNLARHYPLARPGLFNIGLLHTSLTGREGHASYAPCQLEDLLNKGYDYWALGHVHLREEVHVDPWVVFPGNLQGRHIRETGPKGCTLVRVAHGRVMHVEHQEVDVLRFARCTVDVSACTTLEDVWQEIDHSLDEEREQALGRPVAVRVILQGATSLHASLHAHSSKIYEQVRAVAAAWPDVWVEKLQLKTSTPPEVTSLSTEFPGLFETIENLDLNAQSLQDLAPELAVLRSRLPATLAQEMDFNAWTAQEFQELSQSVRDLLGARLQGETHED